MTVTSTNDNNDLIYDEEREIWKDKAGKIVGPFDEKIVEEVSAGKFGKTVATIKKKLSAEYTEATIDNIIGESSYAKKEKKAVDVEKEPINFEREGIKVFKGVYGVYLNDRIPNLSAAGFTQEEIDQILAIATDLEQA